MKEDEKKFYEQARLAFQRLTPEPGDLICVTFPKDMDNNQIRSTQEIMQMIQKEFGVTILLLSEGISMDLLKESDMNELGWFKGISPNSQKVH